MKVADLKRRLTVGTLVTLTTYEVNGKPAPHKYLNMPRIVVKVQSNMFALAVSTNREVDQRSWMDWPRAGQLIETADGFAIIDDDIGRVLRLDYKIGESK